MLEGRLVSGFDAVEKPGDFFWSGQTRLSFLCPCGCGTLASVHVKPEAGGWDWDKNLERPTIAPSIRIMTGCKWHGYLRGGAFITC